MAAYFFTNTPSDLLTSFKSEIDKRCITMWCYDREGDFTHTSEHWKNHAWFRPSMQSDCLIFNIIRAPANPISCETYAVYHACLIQAFLAHLNQIFILSEATPSAVDGDSV